MRMYEWCMLRTYILLHSHQDPAKYLIYANTNTSRWHEKTSTHFISIVFFFFFYAFVSLWLKCEHSMFATPIFCAFGSCEYGILPQATHLRSTSFDFTYRDIYTLLHDDKVVCIIAYIRV